MLVLLCYCVLVETLCLARVCWMLEPLEDLTTFSYGCRCYYLEWVLEADLKLGSFLAKVSIELYYETWFSILCLKFSNSSWKENVVIESFGSELKIFYASWELWSWVKIEAIAKELALFKLKDGILEVVRGGELIQAERWDPGGLELGSG